MNASKAVFVRTSGLGNRLFPWARCLVFSQRNNIPMISPLWFSLRRGPFLKGGVDYKNFYRKILLFDNFQKSNRNLSISSSLFYKLRAEDIYYAGTVENDITYFQSKIEQNSALDWKVFVFKGDMNHFADLVGQREFILSELRSITKAKWLTFTDAFADFPIGMNIRVGKDFKDAKSKNDYYTKGAVRTPISWYKNTLLQIRHHVGDFSLPAYIATDGTENDLKELLDLPAVKLIKTKSAICDLLLMSKSKVFIGSGGSSFSAWVSYLGGMPTVTHPGQSLNWFKISAANPEQFIGEFDPASPCKHFLNTLSRVL